MFYMHLGSADPILLALQLIKYVFLIKYYDSARFFAFTPKLIWKSFINKISNSSGSLKKFIGYKLLFTKLNEIKTRSLHCLSFFIKKISLSLGGTLALHKLWSRVIPRTLLNSIKGFVRQRACRSFRDDQLNLPINSINLGKVEQISLKTNLVYAGMGSTLIIPSVGESTLPVIDINMSLCLIILLVISIVVLVFFILRGKLKNKLVSNKYIKSISQLYLKYNNFISQWIFNHKLIKYIGSTRFYKATVEANNIPLMNPKLQMFHNTLLVRGFRVLGGIFFMVLFFNYITNLSIPSFVIFIMFIWVMTHLIYSMFIFTHTIYYIIKAFIRGDIIYKNSPVSIPLSLWKGTVVCVKGVCIAGTFVFAMASAGVTIDHYYGSPVCRDWIMAQYKMKYLDTLGVDYNNSSNKIFYELHNVPTHIKNRVIIDSLYLSDQIRIGDQLLNTQTKEAQLLLSNLSNKDPLAYSSFIKDNSKTLLQEHSQLFEAQFNKHSELSQPKK